MSYKFDFSIIIPTYNATDIINSALDSVIHQNYDFSKIEVLIIDDGSTDNLEDWIQGYLKRFRNIKLYKKKHGNWGSVINYVSENKLANGEFVMILDPEDRLIFNCLRTIRNNYSQDIDLFITDFYTWKTKEKSNGKVIDRLIYKKVIFSSGRKKFVKRKNIEKTRTPWAISLCKFYKLELFYVLPKLMENIKFQDAIFFNNAINMVHVVKYIPKALGWWRNDFNGQLITKNWNEHDSNDWLVMIFNLINIDAKLIALLYIYYYKDFKDYLISKNIKVRIPGKISMKWVPWLLRLFIKHLFLLFDKKYIDYN